MPTANVQGTTIAYRDEGTGPAVVLIHAFPLNQSMWDEQVSALMPDFRVLTLDLPGFGGSPPMSDPVTIDRMADVVQAIMTERGIERARIVGLSMGGYISFALFRRHPQAVDALVQADTRAGADGPEAQQNRDRMAQRAEQDGVGPIADAMLPKLLA